MKSLYQTKCLKSATRALGLLFHDGDPYHIETSPLICSANQWTCFYMIETYFMKKLMYENCSKGTVTQHKKKHLFKHLKII